MKFAVGTLVLLILVETAFCFKHTLVTPKALRVGAQETAILNLHGYPAATVSYDLQDLPLKRAIFSQGQQVLDQAGCENPIKLSLMVRSGDIGVFRNRQKVVLNVEVTNSGSDFTDTVELYVSKDSGYIFLVTDRPIYKPNDQVKIRAFPLKQSMAPSTQQVTLTIKTPDKIGVEQVSRNRPIDDFIYVVFDVPENPVFGVWSIEASYSEEGYETSNSITFRVQRYVLPTFNVEIETKPYLLLSDKHITGAIKAEYSYGEKVTGNYFLSVKLKKTPSSHPSEIYRKPGNNEYQAFITNGRRNFNVSANFIDVNLGNLPRNSLFDAGASLIIFATVTGSADGVLETALTPEIPLVKSPYLIDATRLSKYYTPSLSYSVQVDIRDAIRGRTINNVPVVIQVGEGDDSAIYPTSTDPNGQINFLIDFTQTGNQRIEITTAAAELQNADQANKVFVIEPYSSTSKSYLQVRNTKPVVKKGRQMAFTFSYHPLPPPAEIRVLILARGSIVHSDVIKPTAHNNQLTKHITATQAMIPSARLVAYYLKDNEVVSVSSYFEVVNECKKELNVSVPNEVLPGARLTFAIKGSPNSIVSLVGVDRAAYFLYDKSRLTRATMFDRMGSFDQGCSQQGGKDGQDVFLEAGLNLATNAIEPKEVNNLECPKSANRKKRDVDDVVIIDMETQLEKCKLQGALPIPNNDNCEVRRNRVKDQYDDTYPNCSTIFYEKCVKESRARLIRKLRAISGKSGSERDAEQGIAESSIRSDFKESLVFSSVTLNQEGDGVLNTKARDSITTFDIDSASMKDEADGFCVAKPTSVRSFKTVFVQLYVPYSLKKMEQANLRLSVFNYDKDNDIEVTLEVNPGSEFCTYYKSGQWSEVAVLNVRAQKSTSASLTVLPLKIPQNGQGVMKVLVKGPGGVVLDSVERKILIEEAGETKDISQSYAIDLKYDRRTQFVMEFSFQERYVIGTRKCWIYAYSNFLGPAIEVDPITQEPRGIASIFRQPYGCGEQLMLTTGPNTYALMYLVNTKKILEGTPAFNTQVTRIQAGYNGEVAYRTNRHVLRPWAVHPSYPPSTWLNAYINKVFAKAKLYYKAMDVTPICNSLRWLLTEQQADGHFRELRPPIHKEMHGAVGGDLTLAAYVLISLEESQSLCLPEVNQQVQASAVRVAAYLQANKDQPAFHRPYGIALLTYAIALHNPNSAFTTEMNARLLSLKSTTDDNKLVYWQARTASEIAGTGIHNYWYRRQHTAVTVEATAYALLAQVQLARFKHPVDQADLDLTRKITKWLINQRNDGGAFVSTQDTTIGLQALATYQDWVDNVEPPNINTDITLSLRGAVGTEWGPGTEAIRQLDNRYQNLKMQIDVPDDVMQSELISVTATGIGEGMMTYRCIYRTEVDEETCAYDLHVDVSELPEKTENGLLRIKISISVSKPVGNPTGMAIVEVGLMSGFVPIADSLTRLQKELAVDGMIDRYEVNQQSVILYLSKIDAIGDNLVFNMEQTIPVAEPNPAKVNVYDYYEPSIRCGKFYALPGDLNQVRTSCAQGDSMCRCAEGGCPTCRTRDEQMSDSACVGQEPNQYCANCEHGNCPDMYNTACTRKFAFVIKVITSIPRDSNNIFVEFEGEIVHSLKKGSDINATKSSNRMFVTRNDCSKKCIDPALEAAAQKSGNVANYFKEGSFLFVVGNIQERSRRGNQWIEKYHLTEESMLERYIPDKKCKSNRDKYIRFNCDNPAASNVEKCAKHSRFVAACDSMDKIKKKLKTECD